MMRGSIQVTAELVDRYAKALSAEVWAKRTGEPPHAAANSEARVRECEEDILEFIKKRLRQDGRAW